MSCISIVIPVYNVEDYLRECVDSVLAQTFPDFDCVLMDDGSTDGCGAICDAYAKADSRIHVLHKANGGQSSARNMGIEWVLANSDSQWLFFLDGDDWIARNCLEVLLRATEQTPISIGGVAYVDNNRNILEVADLPSGLASPEQVYMSHRSFGPWSTDKLFLKADWAEVRFPLGCIYEDRCTTYKVFFKYSRVGTVKDIVYFYRAKRPGNSTTRQLNEEIFSNRLVGLHAELDYFEKRGFTAAVYFIGELLAAWFEEGIWWKPNRELQTKIRAMAKDYRKRYWHSLWRNGRARKCIRQVLHPGAGWLWNAMWKLGGKKTCVPLRRNLVRSHSALASMGWGPKPSNPVEDGLPSTTMMERQGRVWRMYAKIGDILETNGIRYFLSWGSLLGVLRHGDFIPDDDDWDLSVDDGDCGRVLEVLKESLPNNWIVRTLKDNPEIPWSCLRVEEEGSPAGNGDGLTPNALPCQGIHIDLFRYRPAWISPVDARLDDAEAYLKAASGKHKRLASKWHALRVLGWKAMFVCTRKKMAQMHPTECNGLFPWKWIYPLRWVEVRGRRCPLPKEAEKLLVHLYGDWLAMPSSEERMHRHAFLEMNQGDNHGQGQWGMQKTGEVSQKCTQS